ncbi:hypothetical protein TNIN_187731, partial [Trichonephila inaurata madagascariensis]
SGTRPSGPRLTGGPGRGRWDGGTVSSDLVDEVGLDRAICVDRRRDWTEVSARRAGDRQSDFDSMGVLRGRTKATCWSGRGQADGGTVEGRGRGPRGWSESELDRRGVDLVDGVGLDRALYYWTGGDWTERRRPGWAGVDRRTPPG